MHNLAGFFFYSYGCYHPSRFLVVVVSAVVILLLHLLMWGFSSKDYSTLGCILGPFIYGNYNVAATATDATATLAEVEEKKGACQRQLPGP